jgi:hypothetical protein
MTMFYDYDGKQTLYLIKSICFFLMGHLMKWLLYALNEQCREISSSRVKGYLLPVHNFDHIW